MVGAFKVDTSTKFGSGDGEFRRTLYTHFVILDTYDLFEDSDPHGWGIRCGGVSAG
jgi:hypothetical protein